MVLVLRERRKTKKGVVATYGTFEAQIYFVTQNKKKKMQRRGDEEEK